MYQPNSVLHHGRRIVIVRHERYDYMGGERPPFSERINLLRYSLTFVFRGGNRVTINKKGRTYRALQNLPGRLRKTFAAQPNHTSD